MTHPPSPAEELRFLDHELRQLDARRTHLLARRAQLLALLQPVLPAVPRVASPAAPPAARRPETTAPRVQNVLLVLGGALLAVAAIAFTLVSWGHLGIAGRSLVLGAVTLAALGAPVALRRHGLGSTAEAVAGVGLALTVLDAYSLHEVAMARTDGTGYTAVAAAVLAGLWSGYGKALGSLRVSRPAALAAAQLPLPLGAVASGAGPYAIAAALLLTTACDSVVALRTPLRSLRLPASVGAYGLGGWGVLAAGVFSLTATGPGDATRASALLLLAAAIALGVARWAPGRDLATGTAVAGGVLLVAALGGVPRVLLPGVWAVPVHLACGIALAAVVRGRLPEPVRRGFALASAGVQGAAVLWALPSVVLALLGPLGWTVRSWSGAPSDLRDALTLGAPWPPYASTAPLVLVLVTAVLVAVARTVPARRSQATTGATTLGWAALLILPATLRLPYAVGLFVLGATVAGGLVVAACARRTPMSMTAFLLSLLTAADLALLSLASRTATLAVLAALTVLFAVAAAHRRPAPGRASASLATATGLACAVGAAAGAPAAHTALLVLVVPVVAALLAARMPRPAVPVEVTGAGAGLVAVGLAVTDGPVLALVLALCGVIAAGTAVREDRRPAGYAAAVLFLLATWVRLGTWHIGTPEAYTLPVTVPALVVGFVRQRRDPLASSWTAYGPGLSVTLLPSLLMAWGDADWPRPLLLGTAALALTLLGAHHRMQAPLVLGGGVLVLDVLHELAPHLVQLAHALPRWLPPALAGLLLLALGATYEQRLRDARRVREALGRMR
ncbi:SCO7613 C-terminal domain-containing membrane protein [Streptomyces nodosus]|uniref:SCO7613 C-terminal domain-containing membrane protein n=1 Tax=Streptomyces nodosus TaxID=40318 RepID=UPI0036E440BE